MILFNIANKKEVIKEIENLKKKYESKLAKYDAYFVRDIQYYPVKLDGTIYEDSEYFTISDITVNVDCDMKNVKNMYAKFEYDSYGDNCSCRTFYPNTTNSSGQMFEIMDNMQKIIDCEDIVESFINHLKNLDEEYFEA